MCRGLVLGCRDRTRSCDGMDSGDAAGQKDGMRDVRWCGWVVMGMGTDAGRRDGTRDVR